MKRNNPTIKHSTARQQILTNLGPVTLLWNEENSFCTGIILPENRVHQTLPLLPLKALPENLSPLKSAVTACARGQWKPFDLTLLDRQGISDFHWKILMTDFRIPPGTVSTYGMVAQNAGYPKAARAAGGALAGNPWPLVIPCHRVIRSDRRPGGFQSGASTKLELLLLEGVVPDEDGRIPSRFF